MKNLTIFSATNKNLKNLAFKKNCDFVYLDTVLPVLIYYFEGLKSTLEVTNFSNQLVQACDLHLSIDYVKVVLECLAWFTYEVTLPFLNMCELESPKKMLSILPTLHADLSKYKMYSLKYRVDYSFQVHQTESPLDSYITEKFCKQATSHLARQCGREYGFVGVTLKHGVPHWYTYWCTFVLRFLDKVNIFFQCIYSIFFIKSAFCYALVKLCSM